MYFWDDDEAFAIATMEAGNEAYGALERARKYSAHNLTDGIISRAIALTIASGDLWDRLAAIVDPDGCPRFVERVEMGRIRLVGFEKWNRAATDVMARRHKRAESGRLGGLQSGRSRRHDEPLAEASDEASASAYALAKEAAEANPVGTGSGIGSGSGPEGDARGNPTSETRLKSAPPAPLAAQTPPILALPKPPRAPFSDDEQAIRDALRRAAKLRDLDIADIASMAWTLLSSGRDGIKLAWILRSIEDANDVSEMSEQRHVRHSRVVKFIKASKAPKANPADATPRSAAYRESDDPAVLERIRRQPKRVTAQTASATGPPRFAAEGIYADMLAGIGKVGIEIRQPSTDAELEARRLAAKPWAENEAKKAGGT